MKTPRQVADNWYAVFVKARDSRKHRSTRLRNLEPIYAAQLRDLQQHPRHDLSVSDFRKTVRRAARQVFDDRAAQLAPWAFDEPVVPAYRPAVPRPRTPPPSAEPTPTKPEETPQHADLDWISAFAQLPSD